MKATNVRTRAISNVYHTRAEHLYIYLSRRRVVERFKLRLRDALENRIKHKGGVTHAIIREAFLNWDADSSGKLDPAELVRISNYYLLWAWWQGGAVVSSYLSIFGTGRLFAMIDLVLFFKFFKDL